MRTLLFILLGAGLAAWYIRWRTLAARARWRHENAARYARWNHERGEPQPAEEQPQEIDRVTALERGPATS